MKVFHAFLLLTLVAPAAFAGKEEKIVLTCNEELSLNLNPAEYFALSLCAVTQASKGVIPSSTRSLQKLILGSEEAGPAPIQKILESYLNGLKISFDDWSKLSDVVLPEDVALGSSQFANRIQYGNFGADKIAALVKINKVAYEIRTRVRKRLVELEEQSLEKNLRFLTEKELNEILSSFTRNPDLNIRNLRYALPSPGKSNISSWRDTLFADNPKIKDRLEKRFMDEFVKMSDASGEIAESKTAVTEAFLAHLGLQERGLDDFFGKGKLFNSMDDFIDLAKSTRPDAFRLVMDRRIYSAEREQKMMKAIQQSGDFVTFKLIENADLPSFPYIANYSKQNHNMPIIASPAFTQLNMVPQQLEPVFNHPNVHIQTHEILQVSKDLYLINNGAADKNMTPLTGAYKIVSDPLAKVLIYSPMIMTETTANAYYGLKVGYRMTTGSMSDPAFDAAYLAGIKTDIEAANLLKKTQSFTVVSRRYHNPQMAGLQGAADGIGARRVFFTDARYGNPEGLFDLCKIYTQDSVMKIKSLPGLVVGDLHWGVTDPEFLRAFLDSLVNLGILKKNPKFGQYGEYEFIAGDVQLASIMLHDLIDGIPFNRHMKDRLVTMAKADMKDLLDIPTHIQSAAGFINILQKILPNTKIVIPLDNHGYEWINNALQELKLEGYNRRDHALILDLASEAMKSKNFNAYQRLFEKFGVNTDGILFLNKGEQYRIGVDPYSPSQFSLLNNGVNVGPHGQSGINGSKSISLKKMYEAYAESVNAHYHSSAENAGSGQVGSLTPQVQDYHNGGPSKGDASMMLVYSDEAKQLLRYENGTYVPNTVAQPSEQFFTEGLPLYHDRPQTLGGAQNADQYINPTHPKKNRSRRTQSN